MTKKGGQRIATSSGAMLADPDSVGNLLQEAGHSLFDPAFWARRGELCEVTEGRGSAWFIMRAEDAWALRHYRRGGFVARISKDLYLWAGEARVRAFAEWRLLDTLKRQDLPVPTPIAARYQRVGPFYRADLITRRILSAEPLSAHLARAPLGAEDWSRIGATIARFHSAGVDHADLNAHNILIGVAASVSVIDFDRGRIRPAGGWKVGNLRRLHRSLVKIARRLPAQRFSQVSWDALLSGYHA